MLNKSEINILNEIFFSESNSQDSENSFSINSKNNINDILEPKIKENSLNIHNNIFLKSNNKASTKEIKSKEEYETNPLIR